MSIGLSSAMDFYKLIGVARWDQNDSKWVHG